MTVADPIVAAQTWLALPSQIGPFADTAPKAQTSFTATTPGHFALVCGVPGHAPSGMWIHFDVDADAKVPGYTMPK